MEDIILVGETRYSNPDTWIDANTDIVLVKATKKTMKECLQRMGVLKKIARLEEKELVSMRYSDFSPEYCERYLDLEETWWPKSLNTDVGMRTPVDTWCLLTKAAVHSVDLTYGTVGIGEMIVTADSIQWSAALKHSDLMVTSPVLEEKDIRNILSLLI